MNFEEAGKTIDTQVTKLVDYLDKNVKPATKQEMAQLLKKAADKLAKMAEGLEKSAR